MLVIEANILAAIIFVLVLIVTALYGSRAYWKAKAQTIESERSDDGWRSEALFLRHRANKTAAEFAEFN